VIRSRRLRDRGTGERASAAVEFALVLPLVLTMGLSLLQLGLLVKDQLVVAGAARAGAREAAVDLDDAAVRQTATDAAVGLDPSLLDVSVVRQGGSGTAVTVSVVFHAPVDIPVVTWLFPPVVDLSGMVTMRQETG
jgi:Flp pilus assembly protein TadG